MQIIFAGVQAVCACRPCWRTVEHGRPTLSLAGEKYVTVSAVGDCPFFFRVSPRTPCLPPKRLRRLSAYLRREKKGYSSSFVKMICIGPCCIPTSALLPLLLLFLKPIIYLLRMTPLGVYGEEAEMVFALRIKGAATSVVVSLAHEPSPPCLL